MGKKYTLELLKILIIKYNFTLEKVYEEIELNQYSKIKLKCKDCSMFSTEVRFSNLFKSGIKCKRCEFIEYSNKIHKNKYDYSKFIYKHTEYKSIIICPEHDEFEQNPHSHKKGHGCNKCSTDRQRKSTTQFIKESKQMHGEDKYDYSKTEYIDAKTQVTIICSIDGHGEFKKLPSNHSYVGQGCPKCDSIIDRYHKDHIQSISKDKNKLISFNNHYLKWFWDYDKNELTPFDISLSSDKKCWFKCDICRHSFLKRIGNVSNGGWCPYCSHQQLCEKKECIECYNKSFQSCEQVKYWSDENIIPPRLVFKNDNNKYLFNCGDCFHSFESSLNNIVGKDIWCPYCSNKKLCKEKDCTECFNKSFATYPKSKYWDYNKNKLKPHEVFYCSGKKYWFNCDNCQHSFETRIADIINTNRWCPYCCYGSKKFCKNNCLICYENSFASHPKSKYWSNNNKLKPSQVAKSSHKKYLFNCYICYHEFEASTSTINDKETWCNYCCYPPRNLCNCNICYNKSFATYPKSKYWDYNKNKLKPREVFYCSGKKYWFKCYFSHEFESSLSHVVNGSWCPICVNKTEQKVYEYLIDIYEVERQINRMDFTINNKIDLEIDGPQHFEQISIWADPDKTREMDITKMLHSFSNNKSVIRIYQPDVWNDTIDWKIFIDKCIELDANRTTKPVLYLHESTYEIYENHIEGVVDKCIVKKLT